MRAITIQFWPALLLFCCLSSLNAQTPAAKDDSARLQAFQQRGNAALNAERQREKLNPCKNAGSSVESYACTEHELEETKKNYVAYVRAIGGLLRLGDKDQKNEVGEPRNLGVELDSSEVAWAHYRDTTCHVVEGMYTGGHGQSGFVQQCQFTLTRRHIYELSEIYGSELF